MKNWSFGLTAENDIRIKRREESRQLSVKKKYGCLTPFEKIWNKGLTKNNCELIKTATEKMKNTKKNNFLLGMRIKSKKLISTEKFLDKIIDLYVNKRKTTVEISNILNVSYFLIKKILILNNVYVKGFNDKPSSYGENISKSLTGKTYEQWHGKEKAKIRRKKMSEFMKKRWDNLPENKKIEIKKKCWKNRIKRPTCFEKKIINLISEYTLPYKYVGNGDFVLAGKNPDFVNTNGKKEVIEVYYSKLKSADYEIKRAKLFSEYGFRTIFLNENDLNNIDWKKHCLNVIEG